MVRVHMTMGAALTVLALAKPTAASVSVSFVNSCSYEIDLYDNSKTETISVGGSTSRTLADGYHGMFRHGTSAEATLAEFSVNDGITWYDLSVIPPGSGNCDSHEACTQLTGKKGYNVPMAIEPDMSAASANIPSSCASLTCESDACPDAYLYPSDNKKTHDCPESLPFKVTFCPGGSASGPTTSDASSTTSSGSSGNSQAPAQTTTSSPSDAASGYNSGMVKSSPEATDAPAATEAPAASKTSSASAASMSGTISSSFAYEGTNAGSATGTYGEVTTMKSCSTSEVSVTDPVGPISEEATMVFRGPMNIYNIAVFNASAGSDWTKVSDYNSNGTQNNMVFMNNKNIDYSGGGASPQGFATADGDGKATQSTIFGGWLADASNPSTVGGGPGVSTGVEVNIMTGTSCADSGSCLGYYSDYGYHGWGGGMKMFVTKVMMPTGSTVNMPAIWMLNAKVVRASQYGCNCRGMGKVGGCGELDIAEVIETNSAHDKVSTHYYFYSGDVAAGGDNFAARPVDSAVTYVTIIDNSGAEGIIKIIELGGDDFDFSANSVTADTVKAWLQAPVNNLLS